MGREWQTAPPVCLFPLNTARWVHDTPDDHPPNAMTSAIPAPQPDGASLSDDWHTISEELLQGLVHALNNRVAALSALVELATLGDERSNLLSGLPGEIAQLHRLNALFGLLPQRRADGEALDLRAVLEDAIRLHEHHPRLRGAQVMVTFEGAPGAVRAPRWALVRASVMLVHIAKRVAQSAPGQDAAVRVHGDGETVALHVATLAAPPPDLAALAVRCGGRVIRTSDELVLSIPSLRELRRREREARGDGSTS